MSYSYETFRKREDDWATFSLITFGVGVLIGFIIGLLLGIYLF